MTKDVNRPTLWLILFNSAPFHRRTVSIGAYYRLMNLQGHSYSREPALHYCMCDFKCLKCSVQDTISSQGRNTTIPKSTEAV